MKKAIFLDRDGTINVDTGYAHKIKDFKLLEGVVEGLHLLKEYTLFIVTNQSGINRGYHSEEEMHEFNDHLVEELKKNDIAIAKIFFSPHRPDESSDSRKPSPKFIFDAKEKYDLETESSFVVGDKSTDVEFANNGGCKSVFLLTGQGVPHLEEARKLSPSYVAEDLLHAARFIVQSKNEKIIAREETENIVKKMRENSKTVALLNGTFDILHKGHEKILEEAKNQADILIVGLNSDASVKRNKGNDRPINNQEARAKALSSFPFVDYIITFEEDTVLNLLKDIKPEVFVNGSDYGEECIEAPLVKEYGGKIHVVELVKGYSTTNLLKGKK